MGKLTWESRVFTTNLLRVPVGFHINHFWDQQRLELGEPMGWATWGKLSSWDLGGHNQVEQPVELSWTVRMVSGCWSDA